jgi:hypothetical protein
MSRKCVLDSITAFSSKGTSKEFYELQKLLFQDQSTTETSLQSKSFQKSAEIGDRKVSDDIALMFSAELQNLRDDPAFTGTMGQIQYLKELIDLDAHMNKS